MWVKEDIPIYLERINWFAKERGLIASIYGSVLIKGYSEHDLDILVVKYVDNPDIDLFIKDICVYFKANLIDKYKGLFADAYLIDINGKRLDVSIRRENA